MTASPAGLLVPVKSAETGNQVIYQDFPLFPALWVVENLTINRFLHEGTKIIAG